MSVAPYDRLKHLDYIQAVIARLANNAFVMKGWSLTLCSALLGFAVSRQQASLALISLAPAVAFALLDAYYLRQERAFRSMFKDVAASEDLTSFEMNPRPYAESQRWSDALRSFSISAYYGGILIVSLLVFIALSVQPGTTQTSDAPPPTAANASPVPSCVHPPTTTASPVPSATPTLR